MFKKINKNEIKQKRDPCGLVRELYHSDNLSIAHNTILESARNHMHRTIDETYYVLKGKGKLIIGKEILKIKEGDIIPVSKGTWHYLQSSDATPLEVLVVTTPKYNPEDLFLMGK